MSDDGLAWESMSPPYAAMLHSHSPCPPSPSPSPSPSLHSLHYRDAASPSTPSPATSSPSFHVPGPSSRFNQRERTRPAHTRHKSTYTPQGPVLSTEKRAHRRAQSYAGKSIFAIPSPTPPTSDCGPSPLGRMSSFPGENMASSTSSTTTAR